MITKISGVIDSITASSVVIENAGIYYSVMVPPVLLEELGRTHKKGDAVLLFTFYYIEGGLGVGNMIPRLIGFFHEEERRFFEIYTTVKGLGEKKALHSLVIPFREVAAAIENENKGTLKSLPGFGGRMAEKIIAELKGKMAEFAAGAVPEEAPEMSEQNAALMQAAYEVLIEQLGYRRVEAEQLVQKALSSAPEIVTVEELIQKIFQQNSVVDRA